MKNVNCEARESSLIIRLIGHIDSANAAEVEQEITDARAAGAYDDVTINCSALEYISSAGLRIILRLRKDCPNLKVVEVSSEVYEVFEMTGFTEMIDISKAYRVISVEGCEVIGQGANGKVYRIDRDTIVKVYLNPDSLPDIQRERELARKAFVLGVPTAIPYDVVRVGDGYGSVFELLNAKSFAKLLKEDPSRFDEVVGMSVDLLKKIHSTELKPGEMPDMKAVALDWANFLADYMPEDQYKKLRSLIEAVPDDNHMMHGDYHIKNVMLQEGEALLIDMDTLCTGHPIFELASMYNAYVGYGELDKSGVEDFLSLPYDLTNRIWRESLRLYVGDGEKLNEVEDKARIVGYTRIMRRTIRRGGLETAKGRAIIEHCRNMLAELLARVDSLTF